MPHRIAVDERVRQPVLDAAAVFLVRCRELTARVAAGESSDAEVVAVGHAAINQWLVDHGSRWRELLSTRPSGTTAWLRVSVPNNRWFVEHGTEMVSIFDYDGLDQGGRFLLAGETVGDYRFGVCPIQLKIMDREFALLQGPDVDGVSSVMKVTSGPCLEAAWSYWEAALAASVPASGAGRLGTLTPRQRRVMELLAAESGDDQAIADALGVSVRTVRSDVAAAMEKLGVRSRFAAGDRFRIWAELSRS
jgi:DNA-binding CsgD family transcriptional regulator